jgi:hypothetical protein
LVVAAQSGGSRECSDDSFTQNEAMCADERQGLLRCGDAARVSFCDTSYNSGEVRFYSGRLEA